MGLPYYIMISSLNLILKRIIIFLCVALGVGFYTLIERKVLAYIQTRKGPNKVGPIGLPQPLSDALKLFTKEISEIISTNKTIYITSPVCSILVILILWTLYPSNYRILFLKLGILFFLCISRLNVYTILLSGWSSNSKYALLGAVRAIAQTISYEVRIALVLIIILFTTLSFNLIRIGETQCFFWNLIIFPSVFGIWFFRRLAETNRAPFDLAEGESELVSGFNIEYGGGEFAFLFIAEYGRILLICLITRTLFMGEPINNTGLIRTTKFLTMAYTFLWVRGSFPRIRYDTLISLTWKYMLTLILPLLIIWITIIQL